jgi:hypothetical protein
VCEIEREREREREEERVMSMFEFIMEVSSSSYFLLHVTVIHRMLIFSLRMACVGRGKLNL